MTPQHKRYDDTVAPYLKRLRHCTKMAAYYATEARKAAEQLAFLPDWETVAEFNARQALDATNDTIITLTTKKREKV